jgi:DNA-binding transcriptional ArsR family regulator
MLEMNADNFSKGKDGRPEGSFDTQRAKFFEALGHPTRIRLLQVLAEGPRSFSEMKKQLDIESSGKLSFHLGKLEALVKTNANGNYILTDDGKEAVRVVETTVEADGCKTDSNKKRVLRLDPLPIAISIVWAAMMIATSLFLGRNTVVGTEVLEILTFGFIASLLLVTSLGQARAFRARL